jgi:hypothetical protein
MKGAALVTVIAALGMRHGVDPDPLSVIDGLSRFHPSRWNGVYFALGHGIIVTLLAVGFGKLLAGFVAPYTVWILLALGFANLWRLWRPRQHKHPKPLVCFKPVRFCLASSSAWASRPRASYRPSCSPAS